MTKTTQAKPPVAKLRKGSIHATIWQRAGEKGSFYTVNFERRYTDKNGNWHSAYSFSASDLLILADLAKQAHEEILNIEIAIEAEIDRLKSTRDY